ncbi:MAG: hypothetical protein JWL93_899 [Hyphomicrobiales bacterium]|nr:hypothetical protein [Hyphomicrobiales bacterium]
MDAQTVNRCFMRFSDRAERITAKQVAETFVSVGPLMDLLDSRNNQIMYGRRGTGKTHALRYFQSIKNAAGDLAIYIDAQNIGSNGSIYNDTTIPVSERAARLLVDVCSAIHHELLEIFTNPKNGWDLVEASAVLDAFVDGFTETRVIGSTEQEHGNKITGTNKSTAAAALKVASQVSGELSFKNDISIQKEDSSRQKDSGTEETWIDFTFFTRCIRKLAAFVGQKRLWILLDEWTTIPFEIQPYLADLLRRATFSIPNITVKIAAIEHRSNFKLDRPDASYIGFELGADISAAINLDDYLVIDNDETRAKEFFRNFISNHAISVSTEIGITVTSPVDIVAAAFTQENVFTEFVRATAGVPRDAMHILALAAQKASTNSISMPTIRAAAHAFFQTEKYTAIQSNPDRSNSSRLDPRSGDRRAPHARIFATCWHERRNNRPSVRPARASHFEPQPVCSAPPRRAICCI